MTEYINIYRQHHRPHQSPSCLCLKLQLYGNTDKTGKRFCNINGFLHEWWKLRWIVGDKWKDFFFLLPMLPCCSGQHKDDWSVKWSKKTICSGWKREKTPSGLTKNSEEKHEVMSELGAQIWTQRFSHKLFYFRKGIKQEQFTAEGSATQINVVVQWLRAISEL